MKSELPKVLHHLYGKPLIQHVVENIKTAGIDDIIVVVGYKGDLVIETLGNSVDYIWQHEQLGTGHAVMQVENLLSDYNGMVLLACGDVPLIKPSTFIKLKEKAEKENIKGVILTMMMENPTGYGRMIIDAQHNILKIVEDKDATLEEKKINEVNTGTYIFDKKFLFSGLKNINADNAQHEYYLPDVISYIRCSGYTISGVLLNNSIEGIGINSKEELEFFEKMSTETI